MDFILEKKYSLFSAIAMILGMVIGSGIFFKSEKIILVTNGDLHIAIAALLIGGIIMILCNVTFAVLAKRLDGANGIISYVHTSSGDLSAYLVSWFMSSIYYPAIAAVLAWASARYTLILYGFSNPESSNMTFILAGIYLSLVTVLNLYAPIASSKFQVSTSAIKLIPLLFVAFVGILGGAINGQLVQNISLTTSNNDSSFTFFTSLVAVAFAYEGWILATNINLELKNSKSNLPRALIYGSLIVVAVYILYFLGISGVLSREQLIKADGDALIRVFALILGEFGASAMIIFVIISCLGTLNGLCLAGVRGMFFIASKNTGPMPNFFTKLGKTSNMPNNSAFFCLGMTFIYLFIWYGNYKGFWGMFLDISELVVVSMYTVYIPIFIWVMKKHKQNRLYRNALPFLATLSCVVLIIAAFISHGFSVVVYCVLVSLIMLIGYFFKGDVKIEKITN